MHATLRSATVSAAHRLADISGASRIHSGLSTMYQNSGRETGSVSGFARGVAETASGVAQLGALYAFGGAQLATAAVAYTATGLFTSQGPLDRLGSWNPRRYLPTALGGHTPSQMREEHHASDYTAAQHVSTMMEESRRHFAESFGGRSRGIPADADVSITHARDQINAANPGLGHSRHHKIPADRLRAAWNTGTVQNRQDSVRSSMQAMIDSGDQLRGVPVPGIPTRGQQLEAMSRLDPRQLHEWHPENLTIGRAPHLRVPADPGNANDPAVLPGGAQTPRSAIGTALPAAPTGAQVAAALDAMRVAPLAHATVPNTRFTQPSGTTSHP